MEEDNIVDISNLNLNKKDKKDRVLFQICENKKGIVYVKKMSEEEVEQLD